ncbi:DinB family protein [Nocardioides sp. SYSU D00038]|uniref:DinB family protein n=1 Tax=Nocardioides sp. SYSU D00038 TaxID=2812554 RepID=UPI00196829CD|nr:DinB family protein [Nocardioides sp. SYSU D00038]
MVEHHDEDLSGSAFRDVDLSRLRVERADLRAARLHDVDLSGGKVTGALLTDLVLDGHADRLVVNDVDVMPYVEAELDRRHPERPLMRPTTADGYRTAWTALERLWAGTVARARRLPEERLHERVDEEWSFVETLRHLVFATDAWVLRALLGEPSPYHPLGLFHTDVDPASVGVVLDPDLRPSLDEVLAARADRKATVSRVLDELTDERLAGTTTPVRERGYPEGKAYAVTRCLGAVISEEWHHRLFAERDLAVLEQREGVAP